MVKVRLMGTKSEITFFKKVLDNNPKIKIISPSDFYPTYCMVEQESQDPETKKKKFGYYRHYFSVEKNK